MKFSEYLTDQSGMSIRQIALACGYQPSKLTRQLNGTNPLTMESVRDIARATGLDMLTLFEKTGHLEPGEGEKLRAFGALKGASDEDLAGEILRRLQEASKHEVFDESPFQTDFDKAAKHSSETKGVDFDDTI